MEITTILSAILTIIVFVLYIKYKNNNNKIKEKQNEINSLNKEIKNINDKLSESNKTNSKLNTFKDQFLTNISYEIRNPLNAILGYTKLLSKDNKTDNNAYYISQILQAINNILNITENLLDFSKIESGKMTIEQIVFNPLEIITQSISALKFKAEENDIKLEIHIDPFIPRNIIGDPNKLSQILINLISNAIKFSNKSQTVTIDAKCKSSDSECQLLFSITDYGIGIPKSKLKDIFDSFSQENNNTSKFKGTGLNLAIVKQLIEIQKGEITANSEIDKGTTFSFSITYKTTNLTNKDNISSSKKYKILLVEDDPINQELTKDTILSWYKNFDITIANNGKIAIDMLKSNSFDLILMDIQMPVMDGHKATIHIRNNLNSPLCNIPIIGLTAHALLSEKEQALKNGMNNCIIKPFDPNILKQNIDNLLNI